jgi:hypothetical protein
MNKFLFTLYYLLFSGLVYAQSIKIDTTFTPEDLLYKFLSSRKQSVSNIKYTGHPGAIGYYTQGTICPAEGIILSTGFVKNAHGPANTGYYQTSGILGGRSDKDLAEMLKTRNLSEATVLEFDFVPTLDKVKFTFAFASDEYPEFVGKYNDVFAFFLSGDKPSGGVYYKKNLALIPDTDIPITINNVNSKVNSKYYVDNEYGKNIAYDGITYEISPEIDVVPGKTYHLKIVVADYGDREFDSAIFLKSGSFLSGAPVKFNTNCFGRYITFEYDDPGSYKSIRWSFGDGTVSTEFRPEHLYKATGTYILTTEVELNNGKEIKLVRKITIGDQPADLIIKHH